MILLRLLVYPTSKPIDNGWERPQYLIYALLTPTLSNVEKYSLTHGGESFTIVVYSVPFRPERTENLVPVCKPVRDTPPFHLGQNFGLFRPVSLFRLDYFFGFWFLFFFSVLSQPALSLFEFWTFDLSASWLLSPLYFDLSASPLPAAASNFKRLKTSQPPPASSLCRFAHCFCRLQQSSPVQPSFKPWPLFLPPLATSSSPLFLRNQQVWIFDFVCVCVCLFVNLVSDLIKKSWNF